MADDADNAEIKFTPQEHFEFWKKSWRATRLLPEFVPNHFEYHPSVLHQHLLCFGTAHGQVSFNSRDQYERNRVPIAICFAFQFLIFFLNQFSFVSYLKKFGRDCVE